MAWRGDGNLHERGENRFADRNRARKEGGMRFQVRGEWEAGGGKKAGAG